MADNYKEFDKASIISRAPSEFSFKGFAVRKREVALAGTLLVAVIVIVILAAVLGSVNRRRSREPKVDGVFDNFCITPDCLKSGAFIQNSLNISVDPCQDFYNYACGSFKETHPLEPGSTFRTVVSEIYDSNQQKLKRVLDVPVQRKGINSAEQKAKDYHNGCLDDYGKMKLGGNPFLEKVISKVGGWYVLDTMEDSYDYKKMFKKVHVDFWTDALFTFNVRTDWLNWLKTSIQVTPYTMSDKCLPENNLPDLGDCVRRLALRLRLSEVRLRLKTKIGQFGLVI